MIPKRIFYVWIGGNKPRGVEICIENWRRTLPDYEIVEVNEKSTKWFDFDWEYQNNLWFKTVYDLKLWAYVSDYMRVKTLYEHGGIYLDTDVTIYKDISNLLNTGMFINMSLANVIEFAIVGSVKGHKILHKVLDFYQQEIWKSPLYVIGTIVGHVIKKEFDYLFDNKRIYEFDDLAVYPPEYFSPLLYSKAFDSSMVTENTYFVHWCTNSWVIKKNLYFLSNKHKLPLKILLRQIEFIEKNDVHANDKVLIKEENL